MTAEKLYSILKFLEALEKKLELQTKLESVRNALTNLVSQPAQPQYQSTLATALSEFEQAAVQLDNFITPSQFRDVDAMGGGDFFDPGIALNVKEQIQTNAMTPSVARDFVQKLAERRSEFLNTVRTARQGLEQLKITSSTLQPGTADVAFLIPREIFDNKLVGFAKELHFISRLLQDFSEAQTGKAEAVELEQLASSIPTVALAAGVSVIGAVAVVVNKFLEAWERIEKIRKIRAELADIGMKGKALDELTEQITTTVDEVVEETTQIVMMGYPGKDERKNELTNSVRQDVRRLFGQIERGLTVEFRTNPKKDSTPDEQKALKNISDISRVLQFPEVTPEPMLLKGDELLEGEINVRRTRKTVTITSEKKSSGKDTAAVAKD